MCVVGGWGPMFGTKSQINPVFLTPSLIAILDGISNIRFCNGLSKIWNIPPFRSPPKHLNFLFFSMHNLLIVMVDRTYSDKFCYAICNDGDGGHSDDGGDV